MSLERTTSELGWPREELILQPPGAGPAVNATLAREKIGRSLVSLPEAADARVGVLSPDPLADETQAPLALVCEFQRPVRSDTLAELHRLAWSFIRTPLLLTVEPHRLRAFTCCERPTLEVQGDKFPAEIAEARYDFGAPLSLSDQAASSLRWLELASGRFFQRHERRFRGKNRAGNLLVDNLLFVRSELGKRGLEQDIIHDLLARIIFIQFLFHRRDANGETALNPQFLALLQERGILSHRYQTLGEILKDHRDSYQMFRYLNDHFNGDLFPGMEREWRAEMKMVRPEHLQLLSEFVEGRMRMRDGQYSLWPTYSFDVIPLEFISSIYETFVKPGRGNVYTPAHLVDFALDSVLPWDGEEWALKILDPACGSGIFLVKAFQRLIYRWKQANPERRISGDDLRSLLENNLFGVDIDPQAVRVASFSLYLAMCDEIDPRHYWQQVHFPMLRERRLISKDFFSEDVPGLRTEEDAQHYDIVVGNPPWGKNTVHNSDAAKEWARLYEWTIAYGDFGPLFLAKSAALTKSLGRIALLQPCGTLLFNSSSTAQTLRKRLFETFRVEEIVNLATLRFKIFPKAKGPAVLITLCPEPPSWEPLIYIVPKPTESTGDDDYRIVIDPYDIHELNYEEALRDPVVWTALMWGGPRDLALLRWLEKWPTLTNYEDSGRIRTRRGIIRGDRKKEQQIILRRPILDGDFPEDTFPFLDPEKLHVNDDPWTHYKDSTDFSAFEPRQLIIKQAWTVQQERFRAAIIDPPITGALCSDSYISVHAEEQDKAILEAACLSYSSKFAVYYLFLRSARFASYRLSINMPELLKVPCPQPDSSPLEGVKTLTDVDQRVRELFGFKEAEWLLVEDTLRYTLPDFKGDANSPGRLPTHRHRGQNKGELEIHAYCDWFIRVLRAGFGEDKAICATIFEEPDGEHLPVRLVAIHLNWPGRRDIAVEPMTGSALAVRLRDVYSLLVDGTELEVGFRRVAHVFDTLDRDGQRIPTIFIIKPDQVRYWSRSIALRDADEISLEIMQWQSVGGTEGREARTTS